VRGCNLADEIIDGRVSFAVEAANQPSLTSGEWSELDKDFAAKLRDGNLTSSNLTKFFG